MSLQDLQNGAHNFDPTSFHEDFLEQMISGLQSGVSWPDISSGTGGGGGLFDDQSDFVTTKLQQHQINTSNSLFKSLSGDNSIQDLFNGFTGANHLNQTQNFQYPQQQSFGSPRPQINQGTITVAVNPTTTVVNTSGPTTQPRQRVRARRGQATDPHSIAERLRRERIAERMKSLQELVPNANKTDKASMLDEIIDYVKFLRVQVKVLSMSRMGGVNAVSPLVTDIPSEGGRDSVKVGVESSSNNDTMTIAENQVVKLMEKDMGSAMQYLQTKGLCLMPISLATAISTATTNLPVSSVQNANVVLSQEMVSIKDSTSVLK